MASLLESEIDRFLSLEEADMGLQTMKAMQLMSKIPMDDDEAYKYFSKIILSQTSENSSEPTSRSIQERAARSYRAMNILKGDLTMGPSVLIRSPSIAGLLVKDLLGGLAYWMEEKRCEETKLESQKENEKYRIYHIRELLDTIIEKYPEKAMSAAAAGGSQGAKEHLEPLMKSDQTLSVLTHLVCIGTTGRKGVASAEKSAQHTAMYNHMQNDPRNKVSLGQRRKFVKVLADFSLLDELASCLSSKTAGEESCEAILTVIEVIGYPPETPKIPGQGGNDKEKPFEEMVGEDVLLEPLGKPDWWGKLFRSIRDGKCTFEQREAIARVCNHAFALATGNSTRICKSLAPATDATEQTSEKIVQEKEEKVVNRLVEWGLTDKMHSALCEQIPLLVETLNLPQEDIMSFQATEPSIPNDASIVGSDERDDIHVIRHPGRYLTQPLGSWRVQLLSLIKEIITYPGKAMAKESPSVKAMDAIMKLPVPPEVLKAKKKKHDEEEAKTQEGTILNPWPIFVSLVFAYPNNDFYHNIFFQMLRGVVMENHETSLRLILQKSKFLSRAVSSLDDDHLRGAMMNCLNLLSLRSQSLAPSAFLHQYLGSHDGWKEKFDYLSQLTTKQQKPIKDESGENIDLSLGSRFANNLGLSEIDERDAITTTTASESSIDTSNPQQANIEENVVTTKKKKKNKKKKKK